MTDDRLLPMPEPPCRGAGWEPQYREADMIAYARANVAERDAEIEALRAEAGRYRFIAADHSAAWEEEIDAAMAAEGRES